VMQAELGLRCPILHWPLVWLGGSASPRHM
jgi:hypothetical protein